MSTTVFFVVIGAAVLRAVGNALVKDSADIFVAMTAVILGQAPLAAVCLLLVPTPSLESLPYRLAGIGLHIGYQLFLPLSYRAPASHKSRQLRGILGGSASFTAFALVVWAFTQAPIAVVTALRETSIIFALLIGVFVLKERLDLAKVVSTMMTLLGTAILRFSKT